MSLGYLFRMEAEEVREGFVFRADNVALDFTTTLSGRRKSMPTERLARPRDLGQWLKAAGLAQSIPTVSDEDLTDARRLREAIYALALARAHGGSPPTSARLELNRFAARPAAAAQLNANGEIHFKGSVANLLASLAQEAVRVLAGAEPLRQCAGEHCAIVFVDASRAGDRRWCSMAACGNRAKAAEFRRRKGET